MERLAGLVTWLRERSALSILPEDVLRAIAPTLTPQTLPPDHTFVHANHPPSGLYILQQGQVQTQQGLQSIGILPGSVINLQEILLGQPAQNTVKTLSEAQVWFVPTPQFQELVAQYPQITQAFSQQLAQEVAQLSSRLNFEQERQTLLRPYLVTKAKRGIIGRSRYAVKLRQQVKNAATDRQSVLIFGEPGLEKDNTAALIHYGSDDRREPVIKVDCSKLQASGADLFGRAGGKPGLIEALGEGTLIFNNVQDLPAELFAPVTHLLATQTYTPVSRSENITSGPQICNARLILISEKAIPEFNNLVGRVIKVPPLRIRKTDIADQVNYYISLISRAKGINKPHITPEALRRLQAYDFPNNLRELQNLVERSIVQLSGCSDLTEEIIWPSQSKKQQFRVNLLNAYPRFRNFLRSPWYPDRLNYGFTLTAFAIIVGVLFLGPQTRSENFALNLFWAWWWPLVLIGFPFVGRLWCAVCPFMIYGEVTQKLSQWLFPNRQLKRWPRQAAEQWGGWFLFGLFALILLWEELWNLENTAYLSACLLLLITAGAMIFSALFERRFWCRYLCPIGGMNGMFAKLSMTELRAQQGTCSAECTTYQCYKGGPRKGEGLETGGCPLYSHPAQLQDNRDCVLCMTCLKACPHRSVEFNLRPPGIELWTTHQPRSYEVALLLLLLDVVFLHKLPKLISLLGLNWDLNLFWIHAGVSVLALSLPALIPLLAYALIRLIYSLTQKIQPRPFLELAYGYLPLVLAANLAYYLQLGLGEGGRILPVAMATLGLKGSNLPIFVPHPAVISFLQGTTLFAGIILGILLSQKIARQSLKLLLPQHLAILGLGIAFWSVIL